MERSTYEKIYAAHYRDVFTYFYRRCNHFQRAEDLTQEVFLRCWKFGDSLRDIRKVRSWLLSTARREYARTFERRDILEGAKEIDGSDLECEALSDRVDPVLRTSAKKLPEPFRATVCLYLEDISREEIARQLGIELSTVNTRLYRSIKKLKDLVAVG